MRSPSSGSARAERLDLHDLGLFGLERAVDAAHVLVGQLLQAVFRAVHVVGAGLAVSLDLLQVVERVAAHVADRDTTLLRDVAHLLHEVAPPLLGELGDRQADQLAVVLRRQAEVRPPDRALDVADRALVERGDREETRLRRADGRQLVERHAGAVRRGLDAIQERRRGAAGAHARELVAGRLDALVHPPGRVGEHVVDHGFTPTWIAPGSPEPGAGLAGRPPAVSITVPMRSPRTTRTMFCSSSRLKT